MLKYLFDVEFTDGTVYTQNADDRSVIDPEKRSCYYDVSKDVENGKQIKYFLLSDGINGYRVNLMDGSFMVNGATFKTHEEEDLNDFRLIYFRKHTHNFNQSNEELSHEIVFRMGWQANDSKGNNVQRVIEIK